MDINGGQAANVPQLFGLVPIFWSQRHQSVVFPQIHNKNFAGAFGTLAHVLHGVLGENVVKFGNFA